MGTGQDAWESSFRERLIELRERPRGIYTDLARELRAQSGPPFHQQTARPVDEMPLKQACETATIHAKVRDAWGAYVQLRGRAGQSVDEELVSKFDVVDGTYARARHVRSPNLTGPGSDASC